MRATVLPLVSLTLISLGLASAADEQYHIGRWGNALLVTAPASTSMDRTTNAKLGQRITLDFQDASLTDVIDFLRTSTRINIVVAPTVLIKSPTITLKASNMSLGNVLHWITKLSSTQMGYIHGALFISDVPIAEATVTRLYDISDMTMPIKDFPGPQLALNAGSQTGGGGLLFQPVDNDTNSAPTSDEISDLIKKVVAPGKWKE
jgi:hypothetical protein